MHLLRIQKHDCASFFESQPLENVHCTAAASLPSEYSIRSLLQCPLFLIISLTTATILHQISLSRNFLPISPFISSHEDSKRKKTAVVKETLSRKELCSIVFIVPNELNQLKIAHDLD